MEPNNKSLLELRRKALRERRKLQESHGKEVKKKENDLVDRVDLENCTPVPLEKS